MYYYLHIKCNLFVGNISYLLLITFYTQVNMKFSDIPIYTNLL